MCTLILDKRKRQQYNMVVASWHSQILHITQQSEQVGSVCFPALLPLIVVSGTERRLSGRTVVEGTPSRNHSARNRE